MAIAVPADSGHVDWGLLKAHCSAVVIGGTGLVGGSASIVGTLIGGVTMASIRNVLDSLDLLPYRPWTGVGPIITAALHLARAFKSSQSGSK